MKPKNIISLKEQLLQFFNSNFLTKIAKSSGFIKRERTIQAQPLVLSLIAALSKGNCHAIADFHRQFNGMSLSDADNVCYKPFHNQLRKPEFPKFMEKLVTFALGQFAQEIKQTLPTKLDCFDDVLLQDGSSFRVHDSLAEIFPSRFKRTPAAIECHMTMSLCNLLPTSMTITADTYPEREYLPKSNAMNNKLLLADAGYIDFDYFDQVSQNGGFYIVRGKKNLNPKIIEAKNGNGRVLPKLVGKKLKEVCRQTNRSSVLDLKVQRGKQEYRIVRRWFKEEKRFCIWVTNLSDTDYSSDNIMAIYRCRWQVELLFKELKSDTNWRRFATSQKPIVEGLVWASVLALILRRAIALRSKSKISVYKAAKNVDVWFLPILMTLSHSALTEIDEKIDWAITYLKRNTIRSTQRKVRKDITLDGVYRSLNA